MSSKHILTSKYCFGTDELGTGNNRAKLVWKKKFEPPNKDNKIKVVIGAHVSFSRLDDVLDDGPSGAWKGWKEKFEYYDIESIKESKNDALCILTLEKEYNGPATPLCLPEINNNHYEIVKDATILGLGYRENFPDTVKSWLNVQAGKKKRQERQIQLRTGLDVKSSSQCADEFRTWALEKKDGGFTWLEKYDGKRVFIKSNTIHISLLF